MRPQIKVIRTGITDDTTTGEMYLNGKRFCFTLEDLVRPHGVKVPGKTAIPEGKFSWKVTMSNRFKRNMILIYNQADGTLVACGISFAGVRCHGGNTHLNTEGCILVAKNKVNAETIQGTMEKELTKWAIDNGGEGDIEIINSFNQET